jgi:hypothetical protein
MAEQMRRAPAEPKELDEVDPQNDIRIRVVGTIISKDEDSISLDDGTGSTEVFLEEEQMEGLEEGQRIRIFGRVLPTPDSFELQGEVVQDFSEVDPELQDRVKKVVNTNK